MRVLITGAAGFLGRNLYKKMVNSHDFEYTLADVKFDNISNWTRSTFCNTRLIEADLIDCEPFEPFDLVFHCAALLGVDFVQKNPIETLLKNINMFNCLEHNLSSSQTRIVFLSTSEVYGDGLKNGSLMPNKVGSVIPMPDLKDPRSSYALSKIVGEFLSQINSNSLIIRPHNVIGPGMGLRHVVPQIFQKIIRAPQGGSIPVMNPGHIRSFCDIEDATDQIIYWAFSNVSGIQNVGNPNQPISIGDLAEKLIKITGKDHLIQEIDGHLSSPRFREPEIVGDFNFRSLDKTLVEMWDYYKVVYEQQQF